MLLFLISALQKGISRFKGIAGLANKESLVCSGSILKEVVRKNNFNILNVDFEPIVENNIIFFLYVLFFGGPQYKNNMALVNQHSNN